MITSFASGVPQASQKAVSLLGVREPGDWRTWLRRLSRPREPDVSALERALRDAIETRFARAPAVDTDLSALAGHVDRLYAFDEQDSLSADIVASTNGVLGTDGVFAIRLLAHPQDHPGAACDPGGFALEARLLRGSDPQFVQILTATDCITGLDAWIDWNSKRSCAYALFALFVGSLCCADGALESWSAHPGPDTKGLRPFTSRPNRHFHDDFDRRPGARRSRQAPSTSFAGFSGPWRAADDFPLDPGAPLRTFTPSRSSAPARALERRSSPFPREHGSAFAARVTTLDYDFLPRECAFG